MITPSRTPEGIPSHCPICNHHFNAVPSDPSGDLPCPRCGHLIWPSGEEAGARNVDETKRTVRRLVRKIEQTARNSPTQTEMAKVLLVNVVTALAATGGTIRAFGFDGRISTIYAIGSGRNLDFQEFRNSAITSVLKSGDTGVYLPFEATDDGIQNPTIYFAIYVPLQFHTDDSPTAIMEIFQRASTGPAPQRGYLKFIAEMCQTVSQHHKFWDPRSADEKQPRSSNKQGNSHISNLATKISTSLAKWRKKLSNLLQINP